MSNWRFMDGFRRRQRRARAEKFWAAHIANQKAWGVVVIIEDLGDPSGKRLLFWGSPEWARQPYEPGDIL